MQHGGRVRLACRTAEALAEIWTALDAVEAQAVRLPLGHPAVTALTDYVLASRFAVRQLEASHDAECPDCCSPASP